MSLHRGSLRLELVSGFFILLLCAGCGPDVAPIAGVAPGPSLSLGDPYVTMQVDALVTLVTDPQGVLGGAVSPGDVLGGQFVYDESVPDSHHKVDVGRYVFEAPPCGVSLSAGGLDFTSDSAAPAFTIKLLNNKTSSVVHDSYEAVSTVNADVVSGVAVGTIAIQLRDDTATAIDDDILAGLQLDVSDWTSAMVVISGPDGWRIEAALGALDDGGVADERPGGGRKDNFSNDF